MCGDERGTEKKTTKKTENSFLDFNEYCVLSDEVRGID